MREFYTTIDEALTKGLRPEKRMPRGSPYLHECRSLRIGKNALEAIPFLRDRVSFQVTDHLGHFFHYDWPFPQFLKQENWKILVVRDTVNARDMVYSFDDTYQITEVFAIDEVIYGKGSLMEMADFGEYVFLTNGVIMLWWDPTVAAWNNATTMTNIPVMRTVCNFKGQMIGGCVSGWYGCDETFIVWSDIGSVNFTPSTRNQAGFRRDPFGGEVYHVRRLGDDVIVYSSAGITRMFPVSSPAATFGFEELHDVGLLNRGAMNGDKNQHLFVDGDYVAWRVTAKGLEELGYAEYIAGLDAEYGAGFDQPTIVSYNPYKKDFYISDSEKSLLLSPYGMTSFPSPVNTVWNCIESYNKPVELVTDGGLELWTGDDPDHWRKTENGAGSSITDETTIVFEGSHSAKCTTGVIGGGIALEGDVVYGSGSQYMVTMRLYGNGLYGVRILDEPTVAGGLDGIVIPPAEWTEYRFLFTANANSDVIRILRAYDTEGNWSFYVDSVSVKRHVIIDTEYIGSCGLPEPPDEANYPLVVSDVIDMGYRAQKTIFSIEVGGSLLPNVEVAVDYRMHPLVDFTRTDFVPLNYEGVASLIVSGTEFRIVVRCDWFIGAHDFTSSLDYITARWKMTDLRGLRGVYAAPPRGQS